ncbi:hypothetical protein RHECIAT_CH0000496 [Rhizobium etli CIAT 652]|uniref:Bacteriophage tail tape measure N-terminal domain-containing protein n=1 Tax=Rhizobium etli (strain CIAT 652) TaxID=491916 RepID=B3Q057_RHIE6|nr:hypothetical protein RHECIAT_CH0000496 [Rhizobium etli CIAT 652]
MNSTKTLSIVIDPSGTETGGRVVRREFQEIGQAAMNAQRMTETLSKAQQQMAKSAQLSAQSLFQQQDALRAKFNPTYAVLQRYKVTQDEIRQAHRLGALSVNEMTTALSRERQAALSAIAAIKGYNSAVTVASSTRQTASKGIRSFETANLAAQFQDIAVTAAMGMSPLQIALQQGTQLSAVLGPMGAGGAVKGLGAAFLSLLNPVSLVTMGLVAGTAALLQYVGSAVSGTKTVDELLSRHADNIRGIKAAYGEAAAGLKAYVSESKATLAANAGETLEATKAIVAKSARNELSEALGLPASDFAGNINVIDRFKEAINQLKKSTEAGKPDLLAYRDALSQIATSADAAPAQKKLANRLRVIDEDELKAAMALPGMLKAVQVAAEQSAGGLDRLKAIDLSQTTQGATALGTSLQTVSQTAKGTAATVIDVAQQAANSRRQTLTSLEQSSTQLRSMKTELSDLQKAIAEAAKTPVSEVFGDGVAGQAAADAIARAASSVQKVFQALDGGQTTALQAHESLELIRQSLYQIGGDPRIIDGFINALMNGNGRVRDLQASVDALSKSILSIPDKTVNIGIRQYTVPSAGGGSANVNVYGGGNDMTLQQYSIGGRTHNVYGGISTFATHEQYATLTPAARERIYRGQSDFMQELSPTTSGGLISQNDFQAMYETLGYRAAGGPVSAGGTYLVGEKGPEILTMTSAGSVTNANSTASILSGGRDTLSLIEDHASNALQELRIHTNYFETYESDLGEMLASLKEVKSGIASVAVAARASVMSSYGSLGGSYSRRGGGFAGSGGSGSSSAIVDYSSPFMGPGITFTNGTGAIGYATYNITPGITGIQHNPGLKGFATGGQIMPGEDQKVEFFKRNKERVLIVDDSKVSDQRSGGRQSSSKAERPVNLHVNFNGGAALDQRSRQTQADDFRRVVQQVLRS